MAETKPLSTTNLNQPAAVGTSDAAGSAAGAGTSATHQKKPDATEVKSAQPSTQPAVKPSVAAAKAPEQAVKASDPYPSQADLDAMREGKFDGRRNREVRPENNKSESYKTR